MAETGRRQQPGFACEECRRRKARCDRARPKCGYCMETDSVCVVINKKPPRGPKKGHLNALRTQIESLRWQLNQQLGYDADIAPEISAQPSPEQDHDMEQAPRVVEVDSGDLELSSLNEANMDLPNVWFSSSTLDMTPTAPSNPGWTDWAAGWQLENLELGIGVGGPELQSLPLDMDATDQKFLHPTEPTTLTDNKDTSLIDHMRADLDQVFFDRVHPVLPIIYHRRYFSWADQEYPGATRACLRSAMRTMAAAMSAPGRRFCDQLYTETCQLLQAHKVGSKDKIELEYLQAWLLVAHYELLRVGEYQAMLTAGRCFRLVLMARLSDIDAIGPNGVNLQQASPVSSTKEEVFGESFSIVEEQRRICVRLPAPEANFQNNQPVRISFLPEAMSASHKGTSLSGFAECVVLATLYGHCMALRRSHAATESYGGSASESSDFWTRQKRLALAVEKRVQVLGTRSSGHVDSDPMLLFVHMLANSAVIKLSLTAQRASSTWRTVEQQNTVVAYEHRASSAAAEMVRLAKQVPSFSAFKAHPFLPDPLACTVGFLTARNANFAPNDDVCVQQLLRLLRDMQDMNSLARGHVMKRDCATV
ncbi:MAG: hypothetical protein Q9160_005859 [Pyrenula sp. 1 TL-2023]